jgi:predicted phage terminase large subunit-like protein
MALLTNRRKLELLKERRLRDARDSFLSYRKLINPKDKWGWWQEEIAQELQQFFNDLISGKRPKLVIQAPPQHGKSVQIIDFISWLAGKDPELRTIYTSFSERLGVRANLKLQRLYDSQIYQDIFPNTKINSSNSVTISGQFLRNREILEYCSHLGYFRNTTVGGSITGEGLDLGVIDDPIKGRKEANSKTIRDGVWDWFTDDFFTRFSENAGLLCILTRWHIDDPIGRLIAQNPNIKVLSYPAIAIKNEQHRKEGDALFPEHKSIDFLLERKKVMDNTSWLSLYQQSPIVVGGELIKGECFKRYSMLPKMEYRKIYADTAQKTGKQNDYTVFECWGYADGNAYLIDLIRGKWEAPELRRKANDFWLKHVNINNGDLRQMCIEDKASGTGLIQDIKNIDKIPVFGIQRNIDKLTRVQDVLSYIESGFVYLPDNAHFVADFISECEAFTADDGHDHDDQIDPMCDAINDMLAGRFKKPEIRVRRL